MGSASRKARVVSETLTLPTHQNEFDRPLVACQDEFDQLEPTQVMQT